MKKCLKCNKTKVKSEFNFRNIKKQQLQSYCKTCTRKEISDHYIKNKQYYLEKARKRNSNQRIAVRQYIYNYLKDKKCIDCGENDPIVLEFDHKNDKLMAISEIIKKNYPVEKIRQELLKCEVRCANCHRRKTAKDFNWYKYTQASVA